MALESERGRGELGWLTYDDARPVLPLCPKSVILITSQQDSKQYTIYYMEAKVVFRRLWGGR